MVYIFILPLILPLSVLYSETTEEEKPRLAIMDLKAGDGVSPALAEFTTDMLRTGMVNTRLFTIVDRKQLSVVMKEQAFQQSGCTDTTCVAQIGQLLAANKIMTGTLVKIGSKYYINAQIIDVEKGKLDFAESQSSDSLDAMDLSTRELAAKIAGRITGVDTSTLVPRKATEWPYIWRSIVFPGWGQYHNGDKGWAYFFAGSFIGLEVLGYTLRTKYLHTSAVYSNPVPPVLAIYTYLGTVEPTYRSLYTMGFGSIVLSNLVLSSSKQQLDEQRSQANSVVFAIGILYIWNVIHSMVSERNAGSVSSTTPSFVVYPSLISQETISSDRKMNFAIQFPL